MYIHLASNEIVYSNLCLTCAIGIECTVRASLGLLVQSVQQRQDTSHLGNGGSRFESRRVLHLLLPGDLAAC